MNHDLERWLDRLQNLMDIQKDECLDTISATFTRYDLVSLMVLLGSLKELTEKKE